MHCLGRTVIQVAVGGRSFKLACIVARRLLSGVDAILGMDVIAKIGGLLVNGNGVQFVNDVKTGLVCVGDSTERRDAKVGKVEESTRPDFRTMPTTTLIDQDFTASFDGKFGL